MVKLRPIVLKLGGSVITDKTVPFKIRDEVIAEIAVEISKVGRSDLVIVHGGGSVGHYLANKLNILGVKDPRPLDASYILLEMDKLTARIASHLVEKGVPALTVPTHAVSKAGEDGSVEIDESVVRLALSLGYTPLMKGDVILGKKRPVDIVSGDKLASRLALSLGAERLVMCMDQDGIIGPDSKLLVRVKLSEPYDQLLWPSEEGRMDVTGGLGAKLKELEPVVRAGTPVAFLSPLRANRLLNALSGKPFRGTEVVW